MALQRICIIASLLAAWPVYGFQQGLDWVTRFDQPAPGNDNPQAAVLSPTGELCVLSKYNYGFALFKVAADGAVTHESHFSSLANPGPTVYGPAADAAGGVSLARGRIRSGSRRDFNLLRLAPGQALWTETFYADPADRYDQPLAIAVDPAGNSAVAGISNGTGPTDQRLLTVSFDSNGQVRWAAQVADVQLLSNEFDFYGGVRVQADTLGYVYATGEVRGPNGMHDAQLLVVKYSSTGEELWVRRFDINPAATSDSYDPGAIAVNDAGEVYVCGRSSALPGMFTVKFDAGGNVLWFDQTAPSTRVVRAARVDPDGGVYVAGLAEWSSSDWDFAVAHYSPDGQRIFVRFLDGGSQDNDQLAGLGVDALGRAYVGGSTQAAGQPRDLMAVQLLPDGEIGWSRQYNTSDDSASDVVSGFLMDAQGRPTFLVKSVFADTGSDALLVQLDPADGAERSVQHLNTNVGGHDSYVEDLAVAPSGDVYVCGNSVALGQQGTWVSVKYDSAGVEQWRRRVTAVESHPTKLVVDVAGNIVVVGFVASGSLESRDVLVVKYAPDGSEIWRATYDGGYEDSPLDMALDSSGNVLVCGQTVAAAQYQRLVLKVDSGGALLWSQVISNVGVGAHLAVNAAGEVYVNGGGMSVQKFSADGVPLWRRVVSNPNGCGQTGADMALDSDGNVLVVGRSCFTSPLKAMGVVKISPDSTILWRAETEGVSGDAWATCVAIDADDDIFIAGYQQATSNSATEIVTARFSRDGVRRWVVPYRSNPQTAGYGVGVGLDPLGYVYTAGWHRPPHRSDTDFALLRYDLDGNLRWRGTYSFRPDGDEVAQAFAIDAGRRVYISGSSNGGDTGEDFATLRYGPSPAPCAGGNGCDEADIDGDCMISLNDLIRLLSRFGESSAGTSPADGDLDFDGSVSLSDLTLLLSDYGRDCR